jgi:uncharacterized repeat protein (TIGR02543 family)
MVTNIFNWLKRYQFWILVFLLIGVGIGTGVLPVAAQNFGFDELNGNVNLGNQNIIQTVGRVINIFLSILGVIAVALILYGGFIWMTSQGNEEKIAQAKKILSSAVIGLVIVFAAFGIAAFIFKQLESATGVNNGGGLTGCVGAGCLPGGGERGFSVDTVSPADSAVDVKLCEQVQAIFNDLVLTSSVPSNVEVTYRNASNVWVDVTGSGNFSPAVGSPEENKTNAFSYSHPDFEKDTDYHVSISTGVQSATMDSQGNPRNLNTAKDWDFKTGTETDNVAPTVVPPTNPERDAGIALGITEVCLRTPIQAVFSETMSVTSLTKIGNITLTDASGNNVPLGQVVPGSNFKSFTVYPLTPLSPNVTYTVTLKGGVGGISDSCGNTMQNDYTWDFKTGTTEYCTPELTNIDRTSGYYSDVINLTGKNLGLATNNVLFNGLPADSNSFYPATDNIISWTTTSIRLRIPIGVPLSYWPAVPNTKIVAQVGTVYSTPQFIDVSSPYVRSLSPQSGPPGQFVTVGGNFFGNSSAAPAKVTFMNPVAIGTRAARTFTDAELACGLGSWQDNRIIIKVPAGLPVGAYEVQVTNSDGVGGKKSNTYNFTVDNSPIGPGLCSVAPTCSSLSQVTGGGATLTLGGVRFGTSRGVSNVQIAGVDALAGTWIGTWNDQNITPVPVRTDLGNGQHSVAVIVPNLPPSNSITFTVPCSPAPYVIEDTQCSANFQSPSPAAGTTGVCRNALVAARFSTAMNPADFTVVGLAGSTTGNIQAWLCDATSASTSCTNPTPITFSSIILLPNNTEPTGFQLVPTSNLQANSWYQVTISRTMRALDGTPMDYNYTWQFQTGSDICSIASITVTASNGTSTGYIRSQNETQAYSASTQAINCNLLNPASYTWNPWTSSKTIATLTPGSDPWKVTASVTPPTSTNFPDTNPPIEITASAAGKSDTADLIMNDVACTSSIDCTACGPGVSTCKAGSCTPVIQDFSPTSGAIGTWVGINGCYFGSNKGRVIYDKVGGGTVDGLWPPSAICGNTWTNTQIISEVPDVSSANDARTGPITIERTDGVQKTTVTDYTVNAVVHPGLCKVEPNYSYETERGTTSATVTLSGNGFGATQGAGDVVNYQGSITTQATNYPSWSNTAVKAITPVTTAVEKDQRIFVTKNGVPSALLKFDVLSGSPTGPTERPRITDIDHIDGVAQNEVTTVVTIKGEHFGSGGIVKFGSHSASLVDCGYWRDNEIVVAVPALAPVNSTHNIEVITSAGTSWGNPLSIPAFRNPVFTVSTVIRPGICSITPVSGATGTRVTISGRNFTDNRKPIITGSFVSMACNPADFVPAISDCSVAPITEETLLPAVSNRYKLSNSTQVTGWNNKQITILTPLKVRTGDIRVSVDYGALGGDLRASNGVTFTGGPFITSLTPNTGPIGTWITVRGGNFGDEQGSVSFGGIPAGSLPAACTKPWADSEIIIKTPGIAVTARVRVTTHSGLITANDEIESKTFTANENIPLAPGLCQLNPETVVTLPLSVQLLGDRFGNFLASTQEGINWPSLAKPFLRVLPEVTTWTDSNLVLVPPIDTKTGDVTVQKVANVVVGRNCPLPKIQIGENCIGGWEDVIEQRILLSNPKKFTVNTGAVPNIPVSLRVISFVPQNNDTNICLNAVVVANFNTNINSSTVTDASFRLDNTTSNPFIPVVGQLKIEKSRVSFIPTTPLLPNNQYHLTVDASIRGVLGEVLDCGGVPGCEVIFSTSAEVCLIDKVTISPNSWSFTKSNERKEFRANALAKDGQLLTASYAWQKDDPNNLISLSSVTANPTFVTSGTRNGQALLKVTVNGGIAGVKQASAPLDIYICEVPWEFEDSQHNFRLRYCRAKTITGTLTPVLIGTNETESFNNISEWTVGNTAVWSISSAPQTFAPGDVSSISTRTIGLAPTNYSIGHTFINLEKDTSYSALVYAYVGANITQSVSGVMAIAPGTSCGWTQSTQLPRAEGWQAMQLVFNTGAQTIQTLCLGINADTSLTGTLTSVPIYFDNLTVKKIGASDILPALTVSVANPIPNEPVGNYEYFFKNPASPDAIGLRVYETSIDTMLPRTWYMSRPDIVKGGLNDVTVDGYSAVQDGTTVYISAPNLAEDPVTPPDAMYTDMYVMGYNRGAVTSTQTIYQELIKNWVFNTNLSALPDAKAQIKNDIKRLTDVARTIPKALDSYAATHSNSVPPLSAGSYEVGHSASTWYSWQQTLGAAMSRSLPVDPINKFKDCPTSYDSKTCWSADAKKFVEPCPAGSHVYQYRVLANSRAELSFNAEFKNVTWWKGTGSAITIPTTDECDSIKNLINYESPTLNVTSSGNGSVVSNEPTPKISCGLACSAAYAVNTKVALTALPRTGSRFIGWGGVCSSTVGPICTVDIITGTSTFSTSANFAENMYGLNITVSGQGSVTSNVASVPTCTTLTTTTCSTANIPSGTTIALTAVNPMDGSTIFAGWSGACSGTGTCTIMIRDAALSVTATFVPKQTLSLTVNSSGTVTSVDGKVNCGSGLPASGCTADYADGESAILNATPLAGYVFAGWGGACAAAGTSATCTIKLTGNVSVTANFTRISYSLQTQRTGTGSGTVTSTPAGINCGLICSFDYIGDSLVTLQAVPNSDSTFTGWTGDVPAICTPALPTTPPTTCQVTMNTAKNVTATFSIRGYDLTVAKEGSRANNIANIVKSNEPTPQINCGSDCVDSYTGGTSVVLNAAVALTDFFVGWDVNGTVRCGGNSSCTIIVVGATTVTATFEPRATLSVSTSTPIGYSTGTGTVISDIPSSDPIKCGSGGSHCIQAYQQSGTGTPPVTTIVKLIATPDSNSIFMSWLSALGAPCYGSTSLTCDMTMDQDRIITAQFAEKVTLNVIKGGNGTGRVTSSPIGIDCGSDCTGAYGKSSSASNAVTLTASADASSVFTSWSLASCGVALTCTVTMDTNTNVIANFALAYTLTVNKKIWISNTSTIDTIYHRVTSNPVGIDCGNGSSSCSARFVAGSIVSLMPSADYLNPPVPASLVGAYIFDKWEGDCTLSGQCTLTININKTVTAVFKLAPSQFLFARKAGNGTGLITSNPPGINCGADCDGLYQQGSIVSLIPQVTVGTFGGWRICTQVSAWPYNCIGAWTACPSLTGNQCTVTIPTTGDIIAEATFNANILTVTKGLSTGAGTVSSSDTKIDCGSTCSAPYNATDVVTLTAVPTLGSFEGWSGDVPATCTPALPTPPATCQVTMNTAKNVTATFTSHILTLNIASGGGGSGTVDLSTPSANCSSDACTYVYPGSPITTVTLTANPSLGSTVSWSGTDVPAVCKPALPTPPPSTCQVTMDAAKTVTVTFSTTNYTLNVTTTGSGVVTGPNINCLPSGVGCSWSYPAGTQVALVPTPDAGATFGGWSGACTNGTGNCVITMDGNKSVAASFTTAPFAVTVAKAGTGSGTVTSSPAGINCGATCTGSFTSSVTLTATPAAGSTFGGWSGGGCTGTGTCTVNSAVTVTATFNIIPVLTHTYNMVASWNFISLPFNVLNSATNVLFPTATSEAYQYLNGAYVGVTNLQVGLAYFIKFGYAEDVTITGFSAISNFSVPLPLGWNGFGSLSTSVPLSAITYSPGTIGDVYYYNNAWVAGVAQIDPGVGYMTKTSEAGTLTITK